MSLFYSFRIPTLPTGNAGNASGYLLRDDAQKRASYLVAMDSLGLLKESGCILPYNRWLDSTFILPFKLSFE